MGAIAMKCKFEHALNHNELMPFFNGENDYFSPREESWGYHLHMINWESMCSYLAHKDNPFQTLVEVFKTYLSLLNEKNIDDVWALSRNIECFYTLRKYKSSFINQQDDLIDELTEDEKKKIGRSYRFLREHFEEVPGAKDMVPLDQQFEFTRKNGCRHDLFSF